MSLILKDLEILEVSIGLAEEKLDVEDIPSTWALYTDLPFKTISNQEYLCNKSLGKPVMILVVSWHVIQFVNELYISCDHFRYTKNKDR